MNRISRILAVLGLTAGIISLNLGSALAAYWKVDIAAPDARINTRTFNVEFTTLSTDPSDQIVVELKQNGVAIGSKMTTKPYGDSGMFSVTVPADGVYQYVMHANNDGDVQDSATKQVVVDTVATSAPVYSGKTRSGNTYTVNFTAPSNGDVVEVRLFSSPSPSFTANESTQVGAVSVAPGQTASITYTAADSRERYHAVQAFDSAGNGSVLTGDPDTSVVQGLGGANGIRVDGTARLASAGGAASSQAVGTGNVQGSANQSGNVNAPGNNKDVNTNAADLLSDGTKKSENAASNSDSWIAWAIIAVLVIGSLAYVNRSRLASAYQRIRTRN